MSSIGYFYYTSDTQIIICKNNDNTIFLGYDWQFKQLNNIINFANKQLNADLNLENYSSTNQPIDKLITLLSSPQNTRFKLKKLVIEKF